MTYKKISSATNPVIKAIVKLHTASERKKRGLFIIEGQRALSTALTKLPPEALYCTEKMLPQAEKLIQNGEIFLVTDSIMKKISTTSSPSGLLAIVPIPQEPSPEKLGPGLVLADITDPGNMGTLLRTAVACKVSSVIIIGGCDPWSPKVVQATAGTSVQLTIFDWSWEQLISLKKSLILYGLVVHGGQPPQEIDPTKALLIIGNEARGIPQQWLEQCNAQITLPMPGGAESLNAAVAGSIATYLTFVQPAG